MNRNRKKNPVTTYIIFTQVFTFTPNEMFDCIVFSSPLHIFCYFNYFYITFTCPYGLGFNRHKVYRINLQVYCWYNVFDSRVSLMVPKVLHRHGVRTSISTHSHHLARIILCLSPFFFFIFHSSRPLYLSGVFYFLHSFFFLFSSSPTSRFVVPHCLLNWLFRYLSTNYMCVCVWVSVSVCELGLNKHLT